VCRCLFLESDNFLLSLPSMLMGELVCVGAMMVSTYNTYTWMMMKHSEERLLI
jgi:hypothetical protein